MTQQENELIARLDDNLPWRTEGEMPQAFEYVLVDTDRYGMHCDMAIGLWLGWAAVTRWVYRSEIVEVMKQEGIAPKAYGYRGPV